jgi:hypothetical protein
VPTVRNPEGPYRLFFYSFDCAEPPHVHVKRERMLCKFWLTPLGLADNDGFAAHELNRIRALLDKRHDQIMEAWYEHCGND